MTDELQYDGRLTSEAAENDNKLANKAWDRLQVGVFRHFFGSGRFLRTKWGDATDRNHCIDGYITTKDACFKLGLRLQIDRSLPGYPYNSFTLRPNEIQKLLNGEDWTDYKIQGYLVSDWDSDIESMALVTTADLKNYVVERRNELKQIKHGTNGLPIETAFWDKIEAHGCGLRRMR